MILFKPYSSIKDFLQRFTLLKVGKLHIRLHRIVSPDGSTLFHNHPFHYISIILKGGYKETIIRNNCHFVKDHHIFSVILRCHDVYHRIEEIHGETITLFIAWGRYGWQAIDKEVATDDGIYQRTINDKLVWAKKEKGVWYIGHEDKAHAATETRHSIHQVGWR